MDVLLNTGLTFSKDATVGQEIGTLINNRRSPAHTQPLKHQSNKVMDA